MSQSINFLPASFKKARQRRRRVVRQVGLVLLLSACLVGWWAAQSSRTKTLKQYVQTIEAEAVAAKEHRSELGKLRSEQQNLQHRLRVQRDLAQSIEHTQIIQRIGEQLPDQIALTEIRLTADRPEPMTAEAAKRRAQSQKRRKFDKKSKSASIGSKEQEDAARMHVVVQGLAPNDLTVSTLIDSLDNDPLFEQVKISHSRDVQQFGVRARSFELRMQVPLDRTYRVRWEVADAR